MLQFVFSSLTFCFHNYSGFVFCLVRLSTVNSHILLLQVRYLENSSRIQVSTCIDNINESSTGEYA